MSTLQKSPNWDRRAHITSFVHEGYPFHEDWPICGPAENKVFELITRDGRRHTARVDFETQYRAEGLQWRTLAGESIIRDVVIAWREKEVPVDKQ